ncbi:hypothetical protein GCM10018966_069720 [Streptomyces yanii]
MYAEQLAHPGGGAAGFEPDLQCLDQPLRLALISAMGASPRRASRSRRTGADAQATIERPIGTRIGKRQAIELVQRAAADVDAFYTAAICPFRSPCGFSTWARDASSRPFRSAKSSCSSRASWCRRR